MGGANNSTTRQIERCMIQLCCGQKIAYTGHFWPSFLSVHRDAQKWQPGLWHFSSTGTENNIFHIFRRPFVKRFALCYWTIVCLSVTLMYCGQTIGCIKMKLGVQVGLDPDHILLDGDPALPPQGTAPLDFRPISVVAKWLHGSKCHLVWSSASAQGTLCQMGTQPP